MALLETTLLYCLMGFCKWETKIPVITSTGAGSFRDPRWFSMLNHSLLSQELLETSDHDLPLLSEAWRKDKKHRVMHHLFMCAKAI